MNQKELGELLIKMGERLLADGAQYDSTKAAVCWTYLGPSYYAEPGALGAHDTVLAVTAFLKCAGPGDSNPMTGRDIAGMLGKEVMDKSVDEVWWKDMER